MKVAYSWLKDFVKIKIAPQVLAEKLTLAGIEVTSLEKKNGDFIFEFEVTSNRPDCLSVMGIAREVAAILGRRLKVIGDRSNKKPLKPKTCNLQLFSIKIESTKDCPLYTARIIRGVKVGPSPAWLKKRLELIGCRSINNVVDITNYILFTYGEPLHAFDLDKLNPPEIIVRRSKRGERIITINQQEQILDEEILVIADSEKAVALAGIMGGKDTEVTEATKNILLEAAIFNPVVIRRGRQKLGIQTDSSYRFERGMDLETAESAARIASRMIEELTQGRCVLAKSASFLKAQKRIINLEVAKVKNILGIAIPETKIKMILRNLGFGVHPKKNYLAVEVPGYRQDVKIEEDLIEEIARIFGYENIPTSIPKVRPKITLNTSRDLVSLIKNTLRGLGSNEVITYSLIDRRLLQNFAQLYLEPVEILNPLSKEQEILRPTLIPSLVKCVADNLNQKQGYINIFEITKVFSHSVNNLPQEEWVLGIALCGEKSMLLESGLVKDKMGLLHLKGMLTNIFATLGVKDYRFKKISADNVSIEREGQRIGLMTTPQENFLKSLDIKNNKVVAAEIHLEKLFSYADLRKKFTPLPVYPGITRDISLILKEEISVGEILKLIKEKAGPLLGEVNILDYYRGKQIPAGFKGLTISCLYRSDERTLTESEISPLHTLVSGALVEKFGAQIR